MVRDREVWGAESVKSESDRTWQLNNNSFIHFVEFFFLFCEKCFGILKETAVNMQIAVGSMDVLKY